MDVKRQNVYGGYTNNSPYQNKYYYQYLTVEMLESGDFYVSSAKYDDDSFETLYYSKNDGPWTEFINDYINVSAGDKIRFKQTINSNKTFKHNIYMSHPDDHYADELIQPEFNVYGNIMSVVYGDEFVGNNEVFELNGFNFESMFHISTVCDASNLCLPTIQLAQNMYRYMFSNSIYLTKIPKLIPASLNSGCYHYMFDGCKNITGQIIVPTPLYFPTACENAYRYMFADLGSRIDDPNIELVILALLNKQVRLEDLIGIIHHGYIKTKLVLPWEGVDGVSRNDFKAELKYFESENHGYKNYNENWVTEFAQSNDIFGHVLDIPQKPESEPGPSEWSPYISWVADLSDILQNGYMLGAQPLYKVYTVIEPLQYFLNTPLTFETIDICEFRWVKGSFYEWSDASYADFLEYSIEGGPWTKYSKSIVVPANTIISWRASESIESLGKSGLSLHSIGVNLDGKKNGTSRFNAYGNIMSLVSQNFETADTIPYENCFKHLFSNTDIYSAENLILPAINLKNNCYAYMFSGSPLAISPRILPVKNPRSVNSIYEGMFKDCVELQTCPILMLATLFDPPSYVSTESEKDFQNYSTCSNICKKMFYGCNILSTAPEIHICYINTNVGSNTLFSEMFSGCSSIKTYKIFTHSSTPGNYYGLNYKNNFTNMFYSSSGGGRQFFMYNTFPNGVGDLNLFDQSEIGIKDDDIKINMHGDIEEPEEEPQRFVFYIKHQETGKIYECEKTSEYMTWDQFLSNSDHIKLGDGEYPIQFTASKNNRTDSITVHDIYSYGIYGYGYPYDYAGRICNSNLEQDNVLKSDNIITNRTYYINRYRKGSTWY